MGALRCRVEAVDDQRTLAGAMCGDGAHHHSAAAQFLRQRRTVADQHDHPPARTGRGSPAIGASASAWASKGIARQAMSAQGIIQKPVIGTASALAATE